jgi:hypothetical protein
MVTTEMAVAGSTVVEAMAEVAAMVVGRQLAAGLLLTAPPKSDAQNYRPAANRAFFYERIAKAKS